MTDVADLVEQGQQPDWDNTVEVSSGEATEALYSPRLPSALGRAILDEQRDAGRPLLWWREAPYTWGGAHWVEATELSRVVLERLEHARMAREEKPPCAYPTTRSARADVTSAMEALASTSCVPPAYLEIRDDDWPIEDTLVTPEGLLHSRTRRRQAATPSLWAIRALGCCPAPGAHPEWSRRLERLPADEAQCLREYLGLCLVPDTRYQRILSLVGPRRSGKGTILRLLSALLGSAVVATSPRQLGERFGLSHWPGALVAAMPDARWDGDGLQLAAERLLAISGEDAVPVEQKNGPITTVRLVTRIIIAGNSDPKIPDPTGAISLRILSVHLDQSYEGCEDTEVDARLRSELPAIAWDCLDALAELRARGRFAEPVRSLETRARIEEAASPQLAWLAERCELGAELWETRAAAWADYQAWCREAGHHAGARRSWLAALRYSARIDDARKRVEGANVRIVIGLRLIQRPDLTPLDF